VKGSSVVPEISYRNVSFVLEKERKGGVDGRGKRGGEEIGIP